MDKDYILYNGSAFTTCKGRSREGGYIVRVKVDYRKVNFSIRGNVNRYFSRNRVYPVVIEDRLYFVTTDNEEGYRAQTVSGNQCVFSVGGGGPKGRPLEELHRFDGEYRTIRFDNECKLYYISLKDRERP